MNISFYNLGKIKETELDLRPLTVIIGPNNSNKTYIAYSVYGIWQTMARALRPTSFNFRHNKDGSLSITTEVLRKAFLTGIKRSVADFVGELENFYQDSSGGLFSDTKYELDISTEEFTTALESSAGMIVNWIGKDRLRLSLEDSHLVLSVAKVTPTEPSEVLEETRPLAHFDFEAGMTLNMYLRRHLFSRPYLLPAERNAFVITYKVLANRRLKLMLDAQRRLFSSRQTSKRQLDLLREAGEVRYPQPIEDFLEFLFDVESDISPRSNDQIDSADDQPRRRRRSPRSGLGKLADDIEQNIQNGNRINFRQTALGGQEIMVDVGNGLNIDLYNASSSIKQLAPLLLYLRYRAAKGDLLIIDEPEMNLHPESQVKLLELLAILVNQGVYVLLTTHSPYLMSHLNNLANIEEATVAIKRRQAKSLYLNNPSSFLQMDQISAYEMRDGELHTLKDPDYGIRWDTLSDVSADLQQKYFETH